MIQYTLLSDSELDVLEVFKKLELEIPKGHAASTNMVTLKFTLE